MEIHNTISLTGESGSSAHVKAIRSDNHFRLELTANLAQAATGLYPPSEYTYALILTHMDKDTRHYHLAGTMELTEPCDPSNIKDSFTVDLLDYEALIIAARSKSNLRENLHPIMKGEFSSCCDYTSYYPRCIMECCIAIARRAKEYQEVSPFAEPYDQIMWRKITDLNLFPLTSPGCYSPLSQYRHFLFGYNDGYYFIAVPGRFCNEDKPDNGRSGFSKWLAIEGQETYGYWIACADRYNGYIKEFPLID